MTDRWHPVTESGRPTEQETGLDFVLTPRERDLSAWHQIYLIGRAREQRNARERRP